MESPFPAPGKTIKVKTFLPGAGNEVGISAASFLRLWIGAGVKPALPRLPSLVQSKIQSMAPSTLTVYLYLVSRDWKRG